MRRPGLGRDRREDLSAGAAAPRHARLPASGFGGLENPLPSFFAAAGGPAGVQAGATPRQRQRREVVQANKRRPRRPSITGGKVRALGVQGMIHDEYAMLQWYTAI